MTILQNVIKFIKRESWLVPLSLSLTFKPPNSSTDDFLKHRIQKHAPLELKVCSSKSKDFNGSVPFYLPTIYEI